MLLLLVLVPNGVAVAQSAPDSATVPVTLDHNRIIVDVYLRTPDGSKTRVRGWVDNGNTSLAITERLAKKLGLQLTGETQEIRGKKVPTVQSPRELWIGNMPIRLASVKEAEVAQDRQSIAPGMSAEINLPAPLLRNYDVIVHYPDRELTIATPGSLHFEGTAVKAIVNAQYGLIQIPSKIQGETHNLALDLGATVSFLSSDLVTKWLTQHPEWPHMKGAVGPANMWGMAEETGWDVLRAPTVEYGGVVLTNVVAASFPGAELKWFAQRAGVPTAGLIGAAALLNYRVGIDFAHSTVYFQQLSKYSPAGVDVVGLILRPETDGRYTVLGVADYEGRPSVPDVKSDDVLITVDGGRAPGATMGQVWSLLEGRPGTVRNLLVERDGKQFTVKAPVRRFLSGLPSKK